MNHLNPLYDFSNATAAAVERAAQAVVAVNARRHMLASGVHWRDGLIVTASHAVRREDNIVVLLPAGRSVAATLVGRDGTTDLALLKLAESTPALPAWGDPTSLKVGNLLLAVGRVEAGPRASVGVAGVVGGPWATWRGGKVDQLIRLGFDIHPTLSGGLLADPEGRALGIVTAGLSRTLAVAIPLASVNRVVDILLQKGRVPRGYLGVGLCPVALSPAIQSVAGSQQAGGLMVLHIEPSGPADKAGMLMGDILVSLNTNPVTDVGELHALLAPESAGSRADAVVIRAGKLVRLTVEIEERPI